MQKTVLAPFSSSSTVVDWLRHHARATPDRTFLTFLADGEKETERLTFGELERRASLVAAHVASRTEDGDRVLLLQAPGPGFIVALLGTMIAGRIAVPAYPPVHPKHLGRLRKLSKDCEARLGITEREFLPVFAADATWSDRDLPLLPLEEALVPTTAGKPLPTVTPSDVAFLQYTSGSTGDPKGVILTHRALAANELMITGAFGFRPDSVMASWLPVYHDMGLIGNVLQPLFIGCSVVLMPPMAFLQKPRRWLDVVTRYRATVTGAPNFAFELCVKRVKGEDLKGLDLSSLEVLYNGAEPIRADTLARFATQFAPVGFRPEAFLPCYGLAEASLLVAGGPAGAGVKSSKTEATPGKPHVASGLSQIQERLVVVDPETKRPTASGTIGEIWISGENIASGYWNRSGLSQEVFGARLAGETKEPERRYLRTGDLGFVSGGELYVTGRIKDLIIVGGRNHYPQDVEATVEGIKGVRQGCTAAFALVDAETEALGLVVEVDKAVEAAAYPQLAQAIAERVLSAHELKLARLALIEPQTLPKTSSGKLQRRATREALLGGKLPVLFAWPETAGVATVQDASKAAGTAPGARDVRLLSRRSVTSLGETRVSSSPVPSHSDGGEQDVAEALTKWLSERTDARIAGDAAKLRTQSWALLGLDSVAIVEMMQFIQERFGVTVSQAEVLEHTTVERMAVHVARAAVGRRRASA